MKLVIVESPTKSEVISKFLGKDYKVLASEGNIRDLSTRGKGGLGIVVEEGFRRDWNIPQGKRRLVASLNAEAKKAEEVILATDPDREGEAISFHLAECLGLPLDTTKRVTFEEITKDVVLESMKHPRVIDMDLVHAQETRRMEDRVIGFKLSSLLKRKTGLKSAGRVQSAALRMIVDRQQEIDEYEKRKQEYYTIDIDVIIEGKPYKAILTKVDGKSITKKIDELNKNATNIDSLEKAQAIIDRIPESLDVTSVTVNKGVKSVPAMPFTTSTLQQAAYNAFGFSNAKTQSLAQSLFEGKNAAQIGLITYLRTDSTRISPHFYEAHAVPFIIETFGKEYVGPLRKGTGVQGAHEAIRPTGTHRTPEVVAKYVTSDEAKLYRLIYCRALASTMAPKISESTKLTLTGNGLEFTVSGTKTIFKGYTAIYGEFEKEEEGALPAVVEGANLGIGEKRFDKKVTKANAPYNEASIVKGMEENGIGRPSTYATTVDTLLKRKYITAKRGVLTPTEDGKACIAYLKTYFPENVDLEYTAEMERKLDKIAEKELDIVDAMQVFYDDFMEKYGLAIDGPWPLPGQETDYGTCPECGKPLVLKHSKTGSTFIGCSGFPECKFIQKEEEKPTGELCPDCGSPLLFKKSRRGEVFIGCSNYPSCTYTANAKGERKEKKAPTVYEEKDFIKPCPKCDGHIVVKQGKRASFLGCTNFPKCRYHEWIEVKGKKGKKKAEKGEEE